MLRALLIGIFLVVVMPSSVAAQLCLSDVDKELRGVEESWHSEAALDRCYTPPTPTPTPIPPPRPTPSPLPTLTPTPISLGAWWYDSWTHTVTRERLFMAGLLASYRRGYGSHTPELLIRCEVKSRIWDVFVIWDEPIDHPEPLSTYRFGGNTDTLARWFVGEDNDSTFLPDEHLADFLRWLYRYGSAPGIQSSLSINVGLGHPNANITAFWNITGGHYALEWLYARCGFPYNA